MRPYSEAVKADVRRPDEPAAQAGRGPDLGGAGHPHEHPLQTEEGLAAMATEPGPTGPGDRSLIAQVQR